MSTEKANTEQQIIADAERETIAQEVAHMLAKSRSWDEYELVFVLYSKETGIMRETRIEQMVEDIRRKQRQLKSQLKATADERNRGAAFDALAAQGLTRVSVRFMADSDGEIEDYALEIEAAAQPHSR